MRIKECAKRVDVKIIGIIFNCLSILSCGFTVIYFGNSLAQLHNDDFIYTYGLTTCRPMERALEVKQCGNPGYEFGNEWIGKFKLDNGLTLVANPFDFSPDIYQANKYVKSVPMNVSYPCMCRPSNVKVVTDGCVMWTDCILNVQFIKYIQHDHYRYINTHISFIAVSCISVALAIVAIVILGKTYKRNPDYIPMV